MITRNQAEGQLTKLRLDQSTELERETVHAFAALNRWQWTDDAFSFYELAQRPKKYAFSGYVMGGPFDHCYWFHALGKPAAIVTQPYRYPGLNADLRHLAFFVHVHVPPAHYASIHYPGVARFVVLTRRGVIVRWLPEQEDEFSRFALHETDWGDL